jgi:lipoprotein-anchoring transpeptidase ErfK/SrfK
MGGMLLRPRAVMMSLLAVPLALAACDPSGPSVAAAAQQSRAANAPPTVTLAPQNGANDQPITTEIGASVAGGHLGSVSLSDASGKSVAGAMRSDGTSWVPAAPLEYHTRYQATVAATGANGRGTTATTSFSTMNDPGGNRIVTGLYFSDGATYGVGMPIVIEFTQPIPDNAKAAVERRLFVTSVPAQPGVWHWFGDTSVQYRPKDYWQTGTKLTVRAALGGLPVGNRFLDTDRGGTATIGAKQTMEISNADKQLRVYQNDKLVKTFPVSLGAARTPSSSGNLVIMTRDYQTLFDVPGEYRVTVFYAERITWDGQYIHAAPWSVGDQGHYNVSHGCTNVATDNAAWIYNSSHVGDPVTVTGTEVHITPADGWTVWDMSWEDYLKGSALPHPDMINAGASPNGSTRSGKPFYN